MVDGHGTTHLEQRKGADMIDLVQGSTTTVYLSLPRRSDLAGVADLSTATSPTVDIGRVGVTSAPVTISSGITLTAGTTTLADGSSLAYNATFTITSSHLATLGPGLWDIEVFATISGQATCVGVDTLRVRAQVGS